MYKYTVLLAIVAVGLFFSPCLPTSEESLDMNALKRVLDESLQPHWDKAAVGVIDLNSGDVLFQNGGRKFNPASVIKIAVMVAVFDDIERGKLRITDAMTLTQTDKIGGAGSLQYLPNGGRYPIKRLLDYMMIDSDNTATKMLIRQVGISRLNQVIRAAGMADTQVKTANLLEAEGLNYSTVADISNLLYKIGTHQVVSVGACDHMIAIMKRQRSKWGLPRLLPPDIIIAHKTGSLNFTRHDAGIVYLPTGAYVITVFTHKVANNEEGRRIVSDTSYRVFQWMSHNRAGQSLNVSQETVSVYN